MSGRLYRIRDWEKLAREACFRPAVMAALCFVSLRHLERFFLREFKKTPAEWNRELRCRLARQLISEGWLNKTVAAELQYADESHFCHEFKRVYGVSPQTYAPGYGVKTNPKWPEVKVDNQRMGMEKTPPSSGAIPPAGPVTRPHPSI